MMSLALVSSGASENSEKPLVAAIVQARQGRLGGDVKAWYAAAKVMVPLAPENVDLAVSGSRAAAANGDLDQAVAWLRAAVRRGGGLDPSRYNEYAALAGRADFEEVAARARAGVRAVRRSIIFARLGITSHEGLGYDAVSRRFFTGSDEGTIEQIDLAGNVSRFVEGNGLRQILGIEADERRRILWCVTGRYPNIFATAAPAAEEGTTGVYAFDLRTRRRLAAYELDERPTLHGFNDLTVASDGTIYVTDTPQNAIWRARIGKGLELFVREPNLTLPNGIAISADDRLLYVATAEGIRVYDLFQGGAAPLAIPNDATVSNIDGLWYARGSLFGVQPSPYLGPRVIRIDLARDGRSATSVSTLNARSPAEYSYTTVVTVDRFAYVVGGQPLDDPYGAPPAVRPMPHLIRIAL